MATSLDLIVDPEAIPVRNAWTMLLYAWDMARWQGTWASAADAATTLRGLLARVLVDSTQQLLRRQLGRAFCTSVSEIRGIRGRVDFSRSLKGLSFESGRAVCAYPELSVDTPRNRIILSTLARLSADGTIEIGAKPEDIRILRRDIRATIRGLEGVKLQSTQPSDFSRLQLGRNDRDYQLPLAVCHLLHRSERPSEEAGSGVFGNLLRDKISFERLFERFIRNFYRFHRQDARVTAEYLSWFDEIGSSFIPRMFTDITIEWGAPVYRRLVLDTKYYGSVLTKRYETSEKFHSTNLYQMYAYLRTQEDRGPAFHNGSGILLYPATTRSIDERMRVQGHEIRVRTVDLTLAWGELERDLLSVLESHEAPLMGTTETASAVEGSGT